jgi:glycosyltransferase involved in cell wall biosynthesis
VGDGPERASLARHAEEKLSRRCVFTGQLPHTDAIAVMKSADAFVLNSSYEGLSHMIIEALMLGVPTIATHIGGNPEVITDSKNGFLIPPEGTSALASALARVLGDEELRNNLAREAKESAKRFSVETMLSATAHAVTTIV